MAASVTVPVSSIASCSTTLPGALSCAGAVVRGGQIGRSGRGNSSSSRALYQVGSRGTAGAAGNRRLSGARVPTRRARVVGLP